jgi:hypothetical protein
MLKGKGSVVVTHVRPTRCRALLPDASHVTETVLCLIDSLKSVSGEVSELAEGARLEIA